jgi:hypothetical protein
VFFEDQYVYAGTGEEIAKHHAGRTATCDATTSVQLFQVHSPCAHAKRLQRL